ncbi:hypothetical protein PN446_13405 [Microcystis aeruginosa CS-567/02]|nr:hypothetical protein [Microcystis aeruginosa CS-567/02]
MCGSTKLPRSFLTIAAPKTPKSRMILLSGRYSVFQSDEVQKLWVLGKRQEAKGKREEK